MSIIIQDIIQLIENKAPLYYQETYDNSGIQVGDITQKVNGILTTLDITPDVIQEAINKNCNLIIAHHPLIFTGIKKITGKNDIEKCIITAIQNNIVLYAAHTNLDNISFGVNKIIADKLGLTNTQILAPSSSHSLQKLIIYTPVQHKEAVKNALFNAGAGFIGNYSECSFSSKGIGSFKPEVGSQPHIGALHERTECEEYKIEVIIPAYLTQKALNAVRNLNFYEEVAHDIITLQNVDHHIGAGIIGTLATPMDGKVFLQHLKNTMHLQVIKHTSLPHHMIKSVAICGGSGSFLLKNAIQAQADIFITADYKYHQFFEAENKITIADIGHFESEQFTFELFHQWIKERYSEVNITNTSISTNPIKYFY